MADPAPGRRRCAMAQYDFNLTAPSISTENTIIGTVEPLEEIFFEKTQCNSKSLKRFRRGSDAIQNSFYTLFARELFLFLSSSQSAHPVASKTEPVLPRIVGLDLFLSWIWVLRACRCFSGCVWKSTVRVFTNWHLEVVD